MPGGNKSSQYLKYPVLKVAGLFKYMTFYYHQVVIGYFYFYEFTLAEWSSVTISCVQTEEATGGVR